jgi:hypothetical protein
MNRVLGCLAVVAAMALSTVPVAAQVQTGSILVRVSDEQGGAVPGVSVTLASPVLVAGTTSGITDASGRKLPRQADSSKGD